MMVTSVVHEIFDAKIQPIYLEPLKAASDPNYDLRQDIVKSPKAAAT